MYILTLSRVGQRFTSNFASKIYSRKRFVRNPNSYGTDVRRLLGTRRLCRYSKQSYIFGRRPLLLYSRGNRPPVYVTTTAMYNLSAAVSFSDSVTRDGDNKLRVPSPPVITSTNRRTCCCTFPFRAIRKQSGRFRN